MYVRRFLYIGLGIIIIITFSFNIVGLTNPVSSNETLDNPRENLVNITEEEKQVLEKLFILIQEIKEMEKVEAKASIDIENLKEEIANIESLIQKETLSYDQNLSIMEEVLKHYQRNGGISYLELILSSDSLGTLLKRINAIRDITRNTNNLLESLEESRSRLIEEKEKLALTLDEVETKQKELKSALESKNLLRENLEISLASLQEEQAKYKEYLRNIEDMWGTIRPLFLETINSFVSIVEEGYLPPDSLKISFSLPLFKGSIDEKSFNEIIANENFPTKLEFDFLEDKLEIFMPDININLSGTFIVHEKQSILFQVENGSFLSLPLERSAIEELFDDGYLELNFKSILDKHIIKSIKINEENIELYIQPVFF